MVKANVNEVGIKLCEHFGMNPNLVAGISFDWKPGEIATIDFTLFLKDGFPYTVLTPYQLVEIENDTHDPGHS